MIWLHLHHPATKVEGVSTVTVELEPSSGGVTRLTLTHELIDAVFTGWPSILSSLKSLLETGAALA